MPSGNVVVRVLAPALLEVEDDGPAFRRRSASGCSSSFTGAIHIPAGRAGAIVGDPAPTAPRLELGQGALGGLRCDELSAGLLVGRAQWLLDFQQVLADLPLSQQGLEAVVEARHALRRCRAPASTAAGAICRRSGSGWKDSCRRSSRRNWLCSIEATTLSIGEGIRATGQQHADPGPTLLRRFDLETGFRARPAGRPGRGHSRWRRRDAAARGRRPLLPVERAVLAGWEQAAAALHHRGH